MAIVGEASIRVKALKDSFRNSIRDELSNAESDADKSGAAVGRRFTEAANKRFIEGLDTSPIEKNLGSAGDRGGLAFMSRIRGRLTALDDRVLGDLFRRAPNVAGDAGERSGLSFMEKFKNKLTGTEDITNEIGSGLQKQLSKLDQSGPDIGGLSSLATKIVALVPLIGVLGGGLAALVGGLTAMAAAATYASGALAGAATGLAALGGGLVTGFLALSSILPALKEMGVVQAQSGRTAVLVARQHEASAKAIASAERTVESAKKRVGRAEEELANVRRSVAQQSVSDEHSVQEAERRLADAQVSAKIAQQALTAAREDAKEKLEELQLQERGAVIGEEEATLRLRQARAAYTKTLNDPNATADDKEQARLDLQNAELALDQAKDTREDVTKQTNAANKAGIEGSAQVVQAKKNITDANQKVRDEEYALAQARQKQAQDQVDGARQIRDAQQNVADALDAVKTAQEAVIQAQKDAAIATENLTAAQRKLKYMLSQMSPQAAAFTQYLFSLRKEMNSLQDAAGAQLFGPLTVAIKNIVGGFLPTFRQALLVTGGGLGKFALSVSKALTGTNFKNNFAALARDNVPAFKKFGDILGNVLRGFIGLARAASPVFERFLDWVNKITLSFAKRFEGEKNIAFMSNRLKDMGDELAKIGHIFGQTFGAIGHIFQAALRPGRDLNTSLLGTVTAFNKWTGSPAGQKRIYDFFERTSVVAKQVGRALVELVKQFLKLGENKTVGKVFDSIREGLPGLEKAINGFTTVIAPAAIKIIVAIVNAFAALVNSSAVKLAVKIFGDIASAVRSVSHAFNSLPAPVTQPFKTLGHVFKDLALAILAAVIAWKALNAVGKKTGVTGVINQVRSGIARPGTERAQRAKGLGGFIQGARGNEVYGQKKFKNADGSKRNPTAADRTGGNVLGARFRKLRGKDSIDDALHRGHITPAEHEELRAGSAPPRRRLSAGKVSAVATVATVGLAIAPALIHGNISGLKEATKNIGQTIKDNLSTILVVAGPAIFSGIEKGLGKLSGPAKAAGTAMKNLGKNALEAAGHYAKVGAQALISAGKFVIVKTAQLAIAAATKAWEAAQWLLNAALDANPISLIVIGIAALVAGFILAYKHSATFRKIVQESLAAIGKAFKEMWDIAKAIFGFLKDHIQIVLLAFGPLGLAVSAVITVFKNWSKITDIVGKIFDDIVGFFTGLPGRIGSAVTGILGSIGSAGSRIGSAIWNGITGAFGSIVDFIKTPVNFILDAMRGMLKALGKIHLNIFGHKIGFPSDLAKYIPADIGSSPPTTRAVTSGGSTSGRGIYGVATGGTILPRPGGTLLRVAEAGRPESVVDTGLINAQLRASLGGNSEVLAELSRQTDLLRQMVERVALNIENLNIAAHPDEKAEQSVPRTLRTLAYQMGG